MNTATPDVSIKKSTNDRSFDTQGTPAPPGAALAGALVRAADAVSPRLGARLAARVFLSTHRQPLPMRERSWIESAERVGFDVAGRRVRGWSWGDGPDPVLLVHGWDGRGSQMGALGLGLAAAGKRAVAVDLPGHGDTPGRTSSLPEIAAAVSEVSRQLGRVSGIVAHSFGAAASTVALSRALAVEKVAFIAPSEDFRHFLGIFSGWLGLSWPLVERMRSTIEHRFGIEWEQLRGATLAPGMRAPLLVIHDELDREVPLHHGRTYAERWPGADLVVTSGLGHRRILREPEVVERVVSFLAG